LLDAQQGRWLAGSGLADTKQTRDDLTKFLIDYGKTNNGLADSLSQLFALQAQRDVTAKTMMKSGNFKALQSTLERQDAEIAALMEYINAFASQNGYQTDIAKLARVYETRKGDKANQPIFDAITKLAIAEGGLANELKLVNRTANSIDKLISDNKLDAGALTDSLLEGIDEDIEDELAELEEMFQDMQLVIPPIDTSALDAGLAEIQAQAAEYAAELAQIDQMNMMLEDSIMSAMGNGMQALADMMMGLEGADMKNVLAAFIAPLGDTMKQMGAMIMAEGVAMEAFKKSFKNPYAAIAAGAALMAIGSVVSAGLQRLTANPMGGGSGASYGGAGSYGSSELTNYENTLTIEVTGKISGSDIVISGNKTNNKWNR
jgi:hypothetical protein